MTTKNIYNLHTLLKNKKVSSIELTRECLKKAMSSKNNTFISVTEELALVEAQNADQEIAKTGIKSTLHGIPYSLKDLFITKGIRTTAGSKILFNYIPPYDGHVSKSLKNAGGVLIGKVGLDEFGMGSTNENSAFGIVKNPINPKKVPGGSSGGSAASVAEESSYFSMGTDTGGSSRLPANFCGLVGFKPSYGRVSRFGQIAYASSLDQAAPMANTTLDIACVMEHITEKDYHDGTNVNLGAMNIVSELLKIKEDYIKGKKIGLSKDLIEGCASDVKAELNKALEHFKKLGAEIVDITLLNIKHCVPTYYVIATCEASSNLSRYDGIHYGLRKSHKGNLEDTYVESRSYGFGDEVKKRIILGTFSLSSGYYDAYYAKACKVRRLIFNDFIESFKKCDMIFSPVCATTAFDIGVGPSDPVQMYMNDLYTIPANLAGLPAIALPFGKGSDGMPSGFQLIGKQFGDADLLRFGHAFDLSTGRIAIGGV
jgi:aspartyl-tRNA(Asn)/glutamyl-tRNA(Gln) amidotransferase subunit A